MNKIIKEDFELISKAYAIQLNFLKNKSIFITGANGMITTYLSQYLCYLAEEFNLLLYLQCRNIDKANRSFVDFLTKKNIHIVNWDFEKNKLPDIRFDYIIHAASPASTKFFIEKPVDVISPNVIGTWNLLNYAKNNDVKKVLLLSSNSIYGEGGVDKSSLSENDYGIVNPLNERASYIESKRLAEQMGIAFYRQYGVPTSIIRICHTYGPTFDLEKDGRIIPRVIKQILNNEDIVIYKDPHSFIQYTYVADMISAILLVLLCGVNGVAYNAGADELVKMDDVIEWMVRADKKITSKIIEKRIDKNYSFSKGKGINFVKLENDRLCSLGWRQLFLNKDGFTRTVKSYLLKKGDIL